LNVTVTAPERAGFVTVFACGTRPLTSNLNYDSGATVAVAVVAPVDPDGSICIFSSATTHLVVDVGGSFVAPTTG